MGQRWLICIGIYTTFLTILDYGLHVAQFGYGLHRMGYEGMQVAIKRET